MSKHGKKYLEAAAKVDSERNYNPDEAIALVKQTSPVKFDATVEMHFRWVLIPDTPTSKCVMLSSAARIRQGIARPGLCPRGWCNTGKRSRRRHHRRR